MGIARYKAAGDGDLQIEQLLIERDARINLVDRQGRRALSLVMEHEKTTMRLPIPAREESDEKCS